MRRKINLVGSSSQSMTKREMLKVRGGCGCGCCGPSSNTDNACANADSGLTSPANRPDGSGVPCS